jgi:MFS family permease
VSAYAAILRTPRVALLLAATVFARLPIGINHLAIVLFVREVTGSYATAGVVVGAFALGSAAGAPLQGRLVDRLGRRVLVPLAAGHAAGLLCLWLLGHAGAPGAALAALALAAGVVLPPTSSVLRALWPWLLRERPDLVPSAYAVDSVLIELIFIAGPLGTAAVVALSGPEIALAASAASVAGGTVAFVLALGDHPDEPAAGKPSLLGALASPGIRTLVLGSVPLGFCLGVTEVAVPAFSDEHGAPELAGVLLAVWSAASAAGGLLYGARPRRAPLAALHQRFAVLLPLGFLPLAVAGSPPAMALLLIPAGAFIAPLLATRNELVGFVAPPGYATEAFTWPLTALVSGAAAGAAVSGALAEGAGWQVAVVCGAAVAALGALAVVQRRRTLAPAAASSL